jgi:hypothetical protein
MNEQELVTSFKPALDTVLWSGFWLGFFCALVAVYSFALVAPWLRLAYRFWRMSRRRSYSPLFLAWRSGRWPL